ncbi:glycosyltransferase family 2 protein [Flavobacterium sp. XS2P12]|uniref:glycosyltransferase family 2 protein n=1 Tax=Flavobacterium melibiosi TaxID=3398734 RepID=UPI003A83D9B6
MLTIIIPYYKISFFEEALQSLANQTDERFKVYIGDDASPENPSEIVAKYKDQLDLVYHRFETNLGGTSLVQQWERCIALSGDGEWMMILGDDDVLSSNCISEFYTNLPEINEVNCNVVRFSTEIIDEQSKSTSIRYIHPKIEKATDFFYRRFTNKTRSSLSEYIFKRSAYKKYGFYDYNLAWYADDRAWLEFSEFKNIYTINTAIVRFRLSNENISRNNYKTKEKEAVQLQFFKFIVSKALMKFKRDQQKHFMLHYEQLIYKNKKVSFSFWFFLLGCFIKFFYFIEALKFTRRVFIYLKK